MTNTDEGAIEGVRECGRERGSYCTEELKEWKALRDGGIKEKREL